MSQDQITVLIPLFDGVNTLDVNGPLEVLCNYALRKKVGNDPNWCPFKIYIATKDNKPANAYEFCQLGGAGTISYKDALDWIVRKKIDVLITPGYAPTGVIDGLIAEKHPIFDLIKTFFAQDYTDTENTNKQKWIISICVGALLYAYAGVFDDTKDTTTTHWGAVKAIERYSDGRATGIRARFIEGPRIRGMRRLSSGGISCGLDAMLFFLSQENSIGMLNAQRVAQMMDYAWNGGPPQPDDLPITTQAWHPPNKS